MELNFQKHILNFRFQAGTSRGFLIDKLSWILKVSYNNIEGYGECAPLKGLSPEPLDNIEDKLSEIKRNIKSHTIPKSQKQAFQLALELSGYEFPSIRFALETAFLDLLNGGKRIIFSNSFSEGDEKIPINGLVWMGDTQFMKRQIDEKPGLGYKCLKMKIGALKMEEEISVIEYIREKYPEIILRLDANGAFDPEIALDVLERIKEYNIHSIEQPIRQGQEEKMRMICERSPVPVALDEELIGVYPVERKLELLQNIKPSYIILKPTLIGGLSQCNEWITVAKKMDIGWWITSALESNIGLNAIAQYTAEVNAESYQGLGTGQLYDNNFQSPLTIENGYLLYDPEREWRIDNI